MKKTETLSKTNKTQKRDLSPPRTWGKRKRTKINDQKIPKKTETDIEKQQAKSDKKEQGQIKQQQEKNVK